MNFDLSIWLRRSAWTLAAASLLVAVSPAHAQLETDDWIGEIFAGNYAPGPDDLLDDETTFGLRAGTMFTDHVAFVGSVSTVNFEEEVTEGLTTKDLDVDVVLFDFTVSYVARPDRRFNIAFGGGVGAAFSSADGAFTTPDFKAFVNDYDDSSFTVHGAVGPVIHLTDRVYLKPLVRARWFENRDDDETDVETTLAVGIKFGG